MSDIKKVILIGAGDHGRGTLEILKACNRQRTQFEIVGFLDDDAQRHGQAIDGVPVLGGVDWVAVHGTNELQYVLALAGSRAKQALDSRLQGVRFATVCHPSVVVGSDTSVREGSILAAGVVVAYNTIIGRHVTINLNATIGHDCTIADFSTVAPGANVAGRVTIDLGCDIGLNATVVKNISIGAWSVVGPGAVLLRDVPAGQSVFGNPGRTVPVAVRV